MWARGQRFNREGSVPVLAFLWRSVYWPGLCLVRSPYQPRWSCGSPSRPALPPAVGGRRPGQEDARTLPVFGTVSLAQCLSGGLCRASRRRSRVATPRLENASVSVTLVGFPLPAFFPMEWGSQRQLADGWATARHHSGGRGFPEGSERLVGFGIRFPRCPEPGWHRSQFTDEETEALGVKTVHGGGESHSSG